MRMPWHHLAEQAAAEAERAEQHLEQVRAQTRHSDRVISLTRRLLAENHISPKLQLILREARR